MAAEESIFSGVDTGEVSSETLSDAELIAATRAGDAGSFAVLYTRHVDAARACARRLVRSRSEADDLVAEGFAKVLGALRKGKGPDLAFRPYLLTAVRNALYDRARRDSRVEFTDEPPEPVNAVLLGADYDREDKALVAQAYAALPERWQLVLWHTDVEGRQPAEIAPLLGISANSVAALAYRAREGLRQAYLTAHVNRGVSANCRSTTEKLSAYVRDGLSARDRRAVQEHLDGCTSCTALLAELQEANRSLKVVLIPVLAGVSASAYLSGLGGGGVIGFVRRNPTPSAAGAVAAAAVLAFAAVGLTAGGGDEPTARAIEAPPVGSGRPTTTTTTTRPPTTVPRSTTASPTTVFVPPTFDTLIPPITNVPYDPNATTVTTRPRTTTTTTRPRTTTTTTRPPSTTSTTTTTTTQPGQAATTTTTTTTSTTIPATAPPPAPPAVLATVSGLGPVYSGQNAYFSVKIANSATGNGGSARRVDVGPAEGVVVTFNLPANAQFNGASSPDWQCEVVGASVRCLLPRLEAGAATEATFALDVPANQANADFTISPVVMVNGGRIDAPAVQRTVAPGDAILDYEVFRGAEMVVAGNTVVGCSAPGSDNCDTGGKHKVPLADASSATLTLAGRPVQRAYLVWQGQGDPATAVTLNAPSGSHSVTPALKRTSGGDFAAAADVTTLVTGDGVYSVAGVQTEQEDNSYGGWSLIVLVQGSGDRARGLTVALPMRGADGSDLVVASGLAPSAVERGVAVAVFAGEGDRFEPNVGDESIRLNGTALAGLAHPIDGNVFSSTILGAVPADFNSFGTDLDLFAATAPAAETSLRVSATSGPNEGVQMSAIAMLYDL